MYNISEKDYSIVENDNSAFQGVKLKTGTWKNVIVVYGQVGIKLLALIQYLRTL